MRILLILILFTSIISSCNKKQSVNYESGKGVSEIMLSEPVDEESKVAAAGNNDMISETNNKVVSDTSKKIIKTGEISFETGNVQSTRKVIISATKKFGGYVAAENESGYENEQKKYTLNLKVPAKNFDALLQAISSAAERIDSKNIQIQDITAEFIDTKTRLRNKKLLEQRYLELLSKASKITDMLAIENKLSEIRSEIESIEGQFLHMQKQVAYSSFTITFYSKNIVQETGKGFIYELRSALAKGWEFIQLAFFGMISIWPLLFIIIVGVWWYKRRKRDRG